MNELELRKDIEQKIAFLSEDKLQKLQHLVDTLLKSEEASEKPKKERFIGSMKGALVYMTDDFNEPLDDFKDYMPGRHPGE